MAGRYFQGAGAGAARRAGDERDRDVRREELPEDDTLVRVAYSALNYKDGLALTGKNKVVRSYPMVPGIDFSGTVEETTSSDVRAGRPRRPDRLGRR